MNKPLLYLARLALFAVFLTLPFSSFRTFVFGAPIYLPEAVISIAALLFLSALRRREAALRTVPILPIIGFLALFAGITLAAVLTDTRAEPSLGVLKSWIFFPALFAFLLLQVFRSERDMREALFVWFLVSATVAAVTLLPGPAATTTYDGRLLAFFPSPNHLALFLLPGSVLGWFFVAGQGRLPKHFLALGLEGVVLLSLFRTESSGAIVASFLGMAALFLGTIFGRKAARRFLGGILALVTIALATLVLSGTWERYASGEVRHSLASRVMIWSAAGAAIADHPISGIGPRRFQEEYLALQDTFPPYLEWAVPHPHDVFLSAWLSGGLIGLLGFLALTAALSIGAFSGLSRRSAPSRLLPATLFGLGTAFIVAGLVDDTYFKNDLACMFWVTVAFSGRYLRNGKNRNGVPVHATE